MAIPATYEQLWNKIEIANYFGVDRNYLSGIIRGLKLDLKDHPARPGHYFDVADVRKIAEVIRKPFNPSEFPSG